MYIHERNLILCQKPYNKNNNQNHTKVKIPSQHAAYHLLGVDLLLSEQKVRLRAVQHTPRRGWMDVYASILDSNKALTPKKPKKNTHTHTQTTHKTALVRLPLPRLLRPALPPARPRERGGLGLHRGHELLPPLGILPRLLLVRASV